jgi:hypothetical protein
VIDPVKRNGWTWEGTGPAIPAEDGLFQAAEIHVSLHELDWE